MRRFLFWISVGSVVWTYFCFPLATLLKAAVHPRPHRVGDIRPGVSVVIAAHDEAATIGAKLENVLATDYDPERLDVVVAADGCTDGTEAVVRSFADRGVRLLALPRVGKAAALNAAVATCSGDVLVFSDANSMLARDSLRALVRPFADPDVGGVAGDQRYLPDETGAGGTGAGERSYWSIDRLLKRAESRAGNVISATGALYAVRRELFRPVVEGVTDDFITSTAVVLQGYRLVFAHDARVSEPVAEAVGVEFGRKVRVMTRGLRGVVVHRELLDPRRHGYYAVQMLSHKVLRRLMVVPLATTFAASLTLARSSRTYRLAATAQSALYVSGAAGSVLLARRGRAPLPLLLPAYFCMVNVAAARALWNSVRGHRIDRWEPQRAAPTHERVA